MTNLPNGFGYLQDPRIIYQLAYIGDENFIGKKVVGYNKPVCIATERLLAALIRVQDDLDSLELNLALKIFDAYRPQSAVDEFIRWSQDESHTSQEKYYPGMHKKELFAQGYLLEKSSHSRGSAVDLTIVQIDKNYPQKHVELDMGTSFDFFGIESHTNYAHLPADAAVNRQMLRLVMERHGFKNYPKEWWHFNLINEDFPDTYFNFPIE